MLTCGGTQGHCFGHSSPELVDDACGEGLATAWATSKYENGRASRQHHCLLLRCRQSDACTQAIQASDHAFGTLAPINP